MGSYKWVGTSGSFAIFSPFTVTNGFVLAIPAGAVVKRWVVYNTYLDCFQSTGDERGIWSLQWAYQVKYISTLYGTRILHETSRDCPYNVWSYYNSALNPTQPHQNFHGGDNEFGSEGKCSYGKLGAPAAQVELSGSIDNSGPYRPPGSTMQGLFGAAIKALYYL